MGTGTGTGVGVRVWLPQPALLGTAVAAHAVLPAPSFPPGAAPPRPWRGERGALWADTGGEPSLHIKTAAFPPRGFAAFPAAGAARSALWSRGECRRLRFPEVSEQLCL